MPHQHINTWWTVRCRGSLISSSHQKCNTEMLIVGSFWEKNALITQICTWFCTGMIKSWATWREIHLTIIIGHGRSPAVALKIDKKMTTLKWKCYDLDEVLSKWQLSVQTMMKISSKQIYVLLQMHIYLLSIDHWSCDINVITLR